MSNPLVSIEDIPEDTTFLLTLRHVPSDELREAILVRTDRDVRCYLNNCQHLRHVKLDKGDGAVLRDDEIVCVNHGAMFRTEDGHCTHGPCRNSVLEGVAIDVRDGRVHLTDSEYEFEHRGTADSNDDPSSTSNVEF